MMYILKARLFVLKQQLEDKMSIRSKKGHLYVCPRAQINRCEFKDEVDEIKYSADGFKKCRLCGTPLERNQ